MIVYINPINPLEFSLGPVVNSRFEVFYNRLRQVTKEIGADEPKLVKKSRTYQFLENKAVDVNPKPALEMPSIGKIQAEDTWTLLDNMREKLNYKPPLPLFKSLSLSNKTKLLTEPNIIHTFHQYNQLLHD